MAQFDFFGTWDDSIKYVQALTQTGLYTFVVDKWYTEPVPFQFTALTNEVGALLRERRRMWLWSNSYSRLSPSFGPPTSEGLRMIDAVNCGPALDLTLPACFECEGKVCLTAGTLSYQPQYHDPTTGKWYKPSEALKQAYREVKSLLCHEMTRLFVSSHVIQKGNFKSTVETIWVGHNAAKLLETNRAAIQVNGEWRTGAELKKQKPDWESLTSQPHNSER